MSAWSTRRSRRGGPTEPSRKPCGIPAGRAATGGRAGAAALLVALALAATPGAALAADPSGDPSGDPTAAPRRPSCAERYPADGPAGVDLQLGCIAAEIVAGYSGARAPSDPARISAWLLRIALFLAGLVGCALIVRRFARGLDRRFSPAAPQAWWSCPSCRSVNAEGIARCYACGRAWTPDALGLVRAAPDARDPATGREATGEGRPRI